MIPRKVFFTKGAGHGRNAILSFEQALREARISCYNLVTVSSILPPGCDRISLDQGIKELSPGQIVYLVLSRITVDNTCKKSIERIYASIGIAQPKNPALYGYVAESNGVFTNEEQIIQYTQDLATELLFSSKNGEENLEIETMVISADTQIHTNEKFTTCIAAAVFIE
jgi:arginine decarboxylase